MEDTALRMTSLRPFVPSGADFDVAGRFYEELGFTKEWEASGVAGFACGNAQFILQDYNVAEFAANYMLRLDVPDLDEWWQKVESLRLAEKYVGVKLKAPDDYAWGREAQIIDPAGVLWHIGQG